MNLFLSPHKTAESPASERGGGRGTESIIWYVVEFPNKISEPPPRTAKSPASESGGERGGWGYGEYMDAVEFPH